MSETRYEVEWCTHMPTTPEGDADIDRATYAVEYRPTKNEALAFALSVADKDVYGEVAVRMQHRVESEFAWIEEWETDWNSTEHVHADARAAMAAATGDSQ